MAGGEGTRLRPLTCNLPKPMMPIMDKPVMEYTIQLLKKHGIKDIAVTLQYLPESIKAYFGDGSEWGVNIKYYVEETPLGTAGSVKNAREFLDETFVVISGDALTDFNLRQAIDYHRQQQALATIVLTRVESPLEYGLVLTDSSGRISRFLEKPSWGEVFSDTVNTGIYVLEPEALGHVPENTVYDFSRDLFPGFLQERKGLFGCILHGYWCDIGNCEQFHQVHLDILDGKVDIELKACRHGQVWMGEGVRLSPRADVKGPVYIGPYCRIADHVRLEPYTVLGEGCLVGEGASLKRTVIWKGSYIGQDAELRGATIGKGVVIDKKVKVFEGAVISDDTTVEAEAVIKPQVKIWPHKHIEEGRVVSDSVIWSPRVQKNLFKRGGIKGGLNRELTPEKCARIGRALGTFLPVSAQLVVGHDDSSASRLLQNALTCGLLSTGVQVLDAGRLILPAFRHAVASLQKYGVYIRLLPGAGIFNVIVVNGTGADVPKRDERKIENLYSREEFRQVMPDEVHAAQVLPEITSSYLTSLLARVEIDRIKRRRFTVVMAAEDGWLSAHLLFLLNHLGCHITRLDSWQRRRPHTGTAAGEEGVEMVAGMTASRESDLGMFLYDSGQKLALADRRGRVVRDEKFLALLSGVFGHRFQTVYMPVNMPVAAENLVRTSGKRVVRTKTGLNDFMEELLNGGEQEQFQLYADGLYAALRLLEYLSQEDVDLTTVIDTLPDFNYHKREIAVPWEYKGRVIRKLAEGGAREASQNYMEGVRLESPNGWSLILPDEERPVCRIYTEGFSQEVAESLTDFCVEKIKQICQEED